MNFKKTILILMPVLFLGACANAGPGQTLGTGAGAAAGGLLGSLIGGGNGRLLAVGAGTLLGAMAGNAVGSNIDRSNQPIQTYRTYNSGEESAYNRGRADYEAEQQRLREDRAYQHGRSGR